MTGRLGVRVMEGEVVAFREVAILSDQTEYSTVTGLGETEVVIILVAILHAPDNG